LPEYTYVYVVDNSDNFVLDNSGNNVIYSMSLVGVEGVGGGGATLTKLGFRKHLTEFDVNIVGTKRIKVSVLISIIGIKRIPIKKRVGVSGCVCRHSIQEKLVLGQRLFELIRFHLSGTKLNKNETINFLYGTVLNYNQLASFTIGTKKCLDKFEKYSKGTKSHNIEIGNQIIGAKKRTDSKMYSVGGKKDFDKLLFKLFILTGDEM